MKAIINWIANRVSKQNKDCRIIITGESGSGKSWLAGRFAEQIVEKTGGKIYIIFKALDFIELLESGKIKEGDVVIWDEGGVEAMNRNWFSEINKSMLAVFETMRFKNFVTIITIPSFDLFDAGIRKLLHILVETKHIDFKTECVRVQVLRLEYSPRSGQLYKKYFRIIVDGVPKIIKNIWMCKPSQKFINMYEPMKKEYTNGLYQGLKQKIIRLEENKNKDWGKPKDYTKEIEYAKKIRDKFNGKYTIANIRKVMGEHNMIISQQSANQIKEHLI